MLLELSTPTVLATHGNSLLKLEDSPQGQFRWREFHKLVATVWQDTKAVNFLSVVHPATESVQVVRNRRQREGGRTVHQQIQLECPKIASEYGKFMGGVDRNDQMTRVRKGQKQMWWYMRLVIKFLEISAYNAYLLDGFVCEHAPQGSRKYDLHRFKNGHGAGGGDQSTPENPRTQEDARGGPAAQRWPTFSREGRGQGPPLRGLFGEAPSHACWWWWQHSKCCQNHLQMF